MKKYAYIIILYLYLMASPPLSFSMNNPTNRIILNIAIYGDKHSDKASVLSLIELIRRINSSYEDLTLRYHIITLDDIEKDSFPLLYDVLIIPEGESAREYIKLFRGNRLESLKSFLAQGGGLICISSAAYAFAKEIHYYGSNETYQGLSLATHVIAICTNYMGNVTLVAENNTNLISNITLSETNGPVMRISYPAISLFKLYDVQKAGGVIVHMLSYPMIVLDFYDDSRIILVGPRIDLSNDPELLMFLILYAVGILPVPNPMIIEKKLSLAKKLFENYKDRITHLEYRRIYAKLELADNLTSFNDYTSAIRIILSVLAELREKMLSITSKEQEYRFIATMILSLVPLALLCTVMVSYSVRKYRKY